MNLATTPAAFVPEPYMPWLRTDPDMQTAEAFRGVLLLELGTYVFMAPTFPAGSRVAAQRVAHPNQLVPGDVYWLRYTGQPAANYGEQEMNFIGRFERIDRSKPGGKRIGNANGWVDMAWRDDNPQPGVARRADGTISRLMDFDDWDMQLYRISHYVEVPAALAPEFAKEMGETDAQEQWLLDERHIMADTAVEVTVRAVGGFSEPDCRVVLTKRKGYGSLGGGELKTLALLLDANKPLTEYAAKRRKGGAVAFSIYQQGYLSRGSHSTQYFKPEDVAIAEEWLRSLARLRRAELTAHQEAARLDNLRQIMDRPAIQPAPYETSAHEPAELQAAA